MLRGDVGCCETPGSDLLMAKDAAEKVPYVRRDFFAPDALDLPYEDAACPGQLARAERATGEYLVRFDLLRQKAGARMSGGASPGAVVSS